MQREHIERMIENKYSLLLFVLVSLIVVSIVDFRNYAVHNGVAAFLTMTVFCIMLRILKAHRVLFILYLVLASLALFFHYLALWVVDSKSLGIAAMLVYIPMIAILIIFMIKRIFSETLVTADTIKGGISVYLLMATWWQLIYYFLWLMNPQSFIFTTGPGHQTDFLYFSITTMTSVGFGDILPRSYPARVFSMLQAMAGQLYIGIFVARLVGLHIVGNSSRN